jgi:hypothetical protein
MRSSTFVCLLLVSLVYGQAAPPATPPARRPERQRRHQSAPAVPTAPAPEVKVGPDDPVITLKGFLRGCQPAGRRLQNRRSRARNLRSWPKRLQPGMSPAFAVNSQPVFRVVEDVHGSGKARPRQRPSFEEKMHFARMQILSQELSSALQADSNKFPTSRYRGLLQEERSQSYEQATLIRIFIPRRKQIAILR